MFKNILFLFSLALLASCQQNRQEGVALAAASLVQPETGTLQFKLIFVGDIMGHSPQIQAAYDAKTKTYDYNHCFQYVKPILEKADLAVGNLELTMPGKPPYTGYPMFRTPDVLADALKEAGFDLLLTCNNHSNDGGLVGVNHTIDVLAGLGIEQTGTFKDLADRHARYPYVRKFEKDGRFIKYVVLNYTYGTNGIPDHAPSIVNLIDTATMKEDIRIAKTYSPDFIITVLHWGLEYQLDENAEQRKTAQFLADQGVDLIIGSHPHVIQPVKSVKNKKGEEVVVAYSLGNFISNQKQLNTDMGLMVEVTLEKNLANGKTVVADHDWIPVWRYISTAPVKYYTIPAAAIEDDKLNTLKLPETSRKTCQTVLGRTRLRLGKHLGKERVVKVTDIQ